MKVTATQSIDDWIQLYYFFI